jgi:hypothetical protein
MISPDKEGKVRDMKRSAAVMVLFAGLVGSGGSAIAGPYLGDQYFKSGARSVPVVPGYMGAWGQPVPMAAPYSYDPPGARLAQQMIANSMPLSGVQLAQYNMPGMANTISPPGVPAYPGVPTPGGLTAGNLMPASGGYAGMGVPPGSTPPGPGMALPMGGPKYPGAVAAVGALTGGGGSPFPVSRTEVFFTSPLDMKVAWYAPGPDGKPQFTPQTLDVPARYNFLQAAIYRLKLTGIPGKPGLELYPTLEVVPCNPKTTAFLAHSAVPLTITDDDIEQVQLGNYLVKVIYLPDPQFQDLAVTGPSEVVSSRLEPGVDPIAEACRRGSILLVLRMGNIHLELPHTPAMDAVGPQGRGGPPPQPPMGGGGNPGLGLGAPMGPLAPMMPPNGLIGGPPPGTPTSNQTPPAASQPETPAVQPVKFQNPPIQQQPLFGRPTSLPAPR